MFYAPYFKIVKNKVSKYIQKLTKPNLYKNVFPYITFGFKYISCWPMDYFFDVLMIPMYYIIGIRTRKIFDIFLFYC